MLQNAFPLVADTVEAEPLAEPKISVGIELKNDIAITDQGVGASPVTLKTPCSPCAGAASWEFPLPAVMVTVTTEYMIGVVSVTYSCRISISRHKARGSLYREDRAGSESVLFGHEYKFDDNSGRDTSAVIPVVIGNTAVIMLDELDILDIVG